MTRKITPIVRGNIVVWPLIPKLTASVKFRSRTGDPERDNVVVMPVVHITRRTDSKGSRITTTYPAAPPSYNDIQKVLAKTMRAQRYSKRSKRSKYALEKLQKMWRNPG